VGSFAYLARRLSRFRPSGFYAGFSYVSAQISSHFSATSASFAVNDDLRHGLTRADQSGPTWLD